MPGSFSWHQEGRDRKGGDQRRALRVAFGQEAGAPPEPFLVGLATLMLLSQAAEEQPLRTAHDMFAAMGADRFAGQAAAELHATGERARPPPGDRRRSHAQETRVANLAAAGASDSEIVAQLFISPSTGDHHLRKCSASST
jgi:hypothetical protein